MYAHGTPHYNLPQTEGTDKRDWADTNQAFADVDATLYTASETASVAASSVAAITATVAQIGDAQVTLQHDVDELTVTVGSQGTSIGNLSNKIEQVEDDALDMICAVDEGTAQVATVAVAEGKYFRYNNVLYQATAAIAIGDTIVPNTNCRATNVSTELEAITPGGEIIDTTARAGVAANANNIGTMANLNTTDKSSLVAAINEVLSQIGGGGMPALDFANPLHTFSSGNLTFTATKECYLCGIAYGLTTDTYAINGTVVFSGMSNVQNSYLPPLKLSAGDTVVSGYGSENMHVFDVVS